MTDPRRLVQHERADFALQRMAVDPPAILAWCDAIHAGRQQLEVGTGGGVRPQRMTSLGRGARSKADAPGVVRRSCAGFSGAPTDEP